MADAEKEKQGQNEKALADAKAEVDAVKADLEKEKGISENAEKKFQEWAAERGKERKAIGDIAEGMAEETKKRHAAEAARDELATKLVDLEKNLTELQGATEEANRNNQKTTEQKIEELSANLTDEDLKALDAARENADPETQKAIDAGGETYFELLKGLKETQKVAESVLAPWRKKPMQGAGNGTDDMQAKMRALFKNEQQRANSYPNGPNGGQRGGGKNPPVSTRPPNAVTQKKWNITE